MNEMMKPLIYQIRVRGRIPEAWIDAFADLNITVNVDPGGWITRLSGEFSDPAALQGGLNNLYMLGLTLISVECANDCQPDSEKENGHELQ